MKKWIVAATVAVGLGVSAGALFLKPTRSEAVPLDFEQSGCCSHHQGVCGCNQITGKKACCDGTDSKTCRC